MVDETGNQTAIKLENVAKKAYMQSEHDKQHSL